MQQEDGFRDALARTLQPEITLVDKPSQGVLYLRAALSNVKLKYPACDPAALGRATHRDFLLFAGQVAELAARLEGVPGIVALEINISCPNVKSGGMIFGTEPSMASISTWGTTPDNGPTSRR